MMNGLGFLIWKLSNMPAVDVLIPILKAVECNWVSIKVGEYIYKYNQVGGNDQALKAFIQALQDAGIEVGGWHYVYPDKPGPQGDLAEERRQKLGLSHYLLDVEKEWKGNFGAAARTLCGKLHNGSLEAGLCSYRYPSAHNEIPWSAFINHEKVDVMAPQVYWIDSHNPGFQLTKSYDEYKAKTDKPYIPIGATFGVGGWEPSADDLMEFIDWCFETKVPAYGFYSLDWIIVRKRADWLNAISMGGDVEPPPPPVEPKEFVVVNCTWLNGRSEPKVVDDNRVVSVRAGQKVTNLKDPSGDWEKCGLGPITCYMHGDFLGPA
jgi:hypothetical protein